MDGSSSHLPKSNGCSWTGWLDLRARQFLLFARSQTRCEADAHDVLQDALVETWRRAGQRQPDDALVFGTIRRRAIDLARSADRRLRREQKVQTELLPWLEPVMPEAPREDDALHEAVQALPEHLREVLILRIWSELTYVQIAQTLDLPPDTVASRYRYALEHLRKTMKHPLAT